MAADLASSRCSCTPGTACNGRGPQCISGSCGWCGTIGSTCLVGQLCTDATSTGVCKAAPGFPCAGGADCVSGTCSASRCAPLPPGRPCSQGTDCTSGTCNGLWVCS